MVSLQALLVAAAVSVSGETVLLEFSADWCGPCQTMRPTIQRLQSEGFPIRVINVDQQPDLAHRFNVTNIPCFVMLSEGREVDRFVGTASHDRLVRVFESAGYRGHDPDQLEIRAQSPDRRSGLLGSLRSRRNTPEPPASNDPLTTPTFSGESNPSTGVMPTAVVPTTASSRSASTGFSSLPDASPEQRALWATVRLEVEDAEGTSYGTGTIIDTHGDEALVVTCGHIFRDSQGQGRIRVQLFAPQANQPVYGELIRYVIDREQGDIAFVAIRPGVAVQAVPVGGRSLSIRAGERVFSVGCDHGADPTVLPSQITAVDRYLGAANFEVGFQPADGRSGGGLFTADGTLIGICNAADPSEQRGIFAGLPALQAQLVAINQQRIFEAQDASQLADTGSPQTISGGQPMPLVNVPSMPAQMPVEAIQDRSVRPAGGEAFAAAAAVHGKQQGELICIVPDPQSPEGRRVLVVPRPTTELMQALMQASNARGPVVRAQSEN